MCKLVRCIDNVQISIEKQRSGVTFWPKKMKNDLNLIMTLEFFFAPWKKNSVVIKQNVQKHTNNICSNASNFKVNLFVQIWFIPSRFYGNLKIKLQTDRGWAVIIRNNNQTLKFKEHFMNHHSEIFELQLAI